MSASASSVQNLPVMPLHRLVDGKWKFFEPPPKVGDYGISLTAGSVPGRVPSAEYLAAGKVGEPSDEWPLHTQLRYGALYQIIDICSSKDWIQVRTRDGCEVWMEHHRHYYLSVEDHDLLVADDSLWHTVTSPLVLHSVLDTNFFEPIGVGLGSRLPYFNSVDGTCLGQQTLHNVRRPSLPLEVESTPTQNHLLTAIRNYQPACYIWGAQDCSSFVQEIFGIFRTHVPRNTADQARHGIAVPSLSEARSGDCLFFGNGTVKHVGILLKLNGKNHLAHNKQRARIEPMNPDDNLTRSYCGGGRHIVCIRRFAEFAAD